jgi:ATP-binding cassette subfamily F protein 3
MESGWVLEATADRLLLVSNGRVEPFDGDLDDYRRFLLSGENSPTRREQASRSAPREKKKKRATA